MEQAVKTGMEAKITEEMVQDLLREQGKEYQSRWRFNRVATEDGIRHWAEGIGDLNPLWQNAEYAAKTRVGGIIAPPSFIFSCAMTAGRLGMPGIHALHTGTRIIFHKPIKAGTVVIPKGGLSKLIEKQSSFAGRSYLQEMVINYRDPQGELLTQMFTHMIRTEREASAGSTKYKGLQQHVYTAAELKEIDDAIERHERRGAAPRYWDDVEVDTELAPLPKGPLTITDVVAFKIGWGFYPFTFANEVRREFCKRHPDTPVRNHLNIPDSPERVHFNHELPNKIGIPGFYDYGPQRIAWLLQLVTDWAGDDGWIKEARLEVRRPGIEGDVQWCKAKVTDKKLLGGEGVVQLSLWADNQRGETSARGDASVVLPRRSDR